MDLYRRCLLSMAVVCLGAVPALAQTIYVPKPKGDDTSLDVAIKPGKKVGPDELKFGPGSTVKGDIIDISEDGLVSMKSADLKGTLQVLLGSAKSLKFGANGMIYDDLTSSKWSASADFAYVTD